MATNLTERRVVVTGLGVVTPLGHQVDAFWNNLLAGQCGIARIARFDSSKFDCQIAAEVKNFDPAPAFPAPKELRRTDRFSHFGIHAGSQALRDSGLDLNSINRDEVGVFIGSGIGGLQTVSEQCQVLLERVWGWEFGGGTRTVDVHIHWLREKIEIDPSNPTRIVTVHGSGYRFEG